MEDVGRLARAVLAQDSGRLERVLADVARDDVAAVEAAMAAAAQLPRPAPVVARLLDHCDAATPSAGALLWVVTGCAAEDADVVARMLRRGVAVTRAVLLAAVASGHPGVVRAVAAHARDRGDWAAAVLSAARTKGPAVVEALLAAGGDPPPPEALQLAARRRRLDVVEVLLERGGGKAYAQRYAAWAVERGIPGAGALRRALRG